MSKTLWWILTYGNEFFIFVISFFLSEGKEKCVAVVSILKVFPIKARLSTLNIIKSVLILNELSLE